MSPASKAKSKEKLAAKAVKEQLKASSKPSPPANGGNGTPASAYNPSSGTFHSLDTAPSAITPMPQTIGRFRTIDETEDHSGSALGSAADYDSVSNNDSCSGESEDIKEKNVNSLPRLEAIPGSDTDKRDKVRQKNEKKHQRQRERRAQELHERCSGYLMARKLEALAQQLVAMGFSSEKATMALILNEGRVEESVAWLFEGLNEGEPIATNVDGGNLKIDISDELAKIADMEISFKCSKQEIERAIVACEGDLEKATENLKAQKQEPPAAPPKPEESGDPPTINVVNKVAVSSKNSMIRTQVKPVASVAMQPQRRDDQDLNYSKSIAVGTVPLDSGNRNLQPLRRVSSKSEWTRSQVVAPVDKRWTNPSSSPSVSSYSLASTLLVAVPPTNTEIRYGGEVKTILQAGGALREPVTVMQRPQLNNQKPNPQTANVVVNASSPVNNGWPPTANGEMTMVANGSLGPSLTSRIYNQGPQRFSSHNQYQLFIPNSLDGGGGGASGWNGSWNATGMSSGTNPSLHDVPSSLGLFTGWGSTGSSGASSPVDWSTGGDTMPKCDYTSIDWSLDATPLGLNLPPLKGDRCLHDTWSTAFMASNPERPPMNGGVHVAGLQEGDFTMDTTAGSREWTSPFAGRDLFSVPRQFVTSPSPLGKQM